MCAMATPTNDNQKLWTPANVITLIRICLVPLFVVAIISPWPEWFSLPPVANQEKSLVAAFIFVVISCTDWLDGYLARSRNEVTNFGKFMDPLADKILVTAALLALIELGTLPSWVVLIILAREFIVSGVRMMAASEGVVIAASWYGKCKTVFQMIAIVLFTIKDSYMVGSINDAFGDILWMVSWAVMIIALILTIVSMLDYVVKAKDLIGFSPKKSPKANDGMIDITPDGARELSPVEKRSINPHELESLAQDVINLARKNACTIGCAESLTGGLITGALTAIPGSSSVVKGSVVSYAPSIKEKLLHVPHQTITDDGVVSDATAEAMAQGALQALDCTISVAVTGIAGPQGAEPGKPVGTVWIGFATSNTCTSQEFIFPGTREEVRLLTVHAALCTIKSYLEAL